MISRGVLMKALVKWEARFGLWVDRVPIPITGPDDVLIKISKTGICRADIDIY